MSLETLNFQAYFGFQPNSNASAELRASNNQIVVTLGRDGLDENEMEYLLSRYGVVEEFLDENMNIDLFLEIKNLVSNHRSR